MRAFLSLLIVLTVVSISHGQTQPDTTKLVAESVMYPARALVLSLAIPGAGQWYAGSKKKALIFASLEVAGILAWYQFRQNGEQLALDYQDFADEHWALKSWVEWAPYLYAQGEEYHDVIIDGTHHLMIILEDNSIVSSDTLASPEWEGNLDQVEVIRSSEFYENVGKYDQFVTGWDDLFGKTGEPAWRLVEKDVGDTAEVIIMTDNKQKYLNLRKDSNRAFQLAGYVVSAIMFNHVISAIDAFLETRRRTLPTPEVDMSIRPLYSPDSRFGVGGIALSIHW